MELSRRLETIIEMISPGKMVADIGTDHGFVPIELVRRGICTAGIAADVGEGPLARAKEHIEKAGLHKKIQTRQGDGLSPLVPGEADRLVIAGMGGPLMARILSQGENVAREIQEMILSPQSEIEMFRRFLRENHYNIVEERALWDEKKYYVVLRINSGDRQEYTPEEYAYGKVSCMSPSSRKARGIYLQKEITTAQNIEERLQKELIQKSSEQGDSTLLCERLKEISRKRKWLEKIWQESGEEGGEQG